MRRAITVLVSLMGSSACAHGSTVQKIDVDTYRIACPDLPLDRCLGEAAHNTCDKRAYFVARGISEVNLRGRSDSPDVLSSSEAVIRCAPSYGWGEEGKALMAASPRAPTVPSASSPSKASAPVCAPGATQACVGSAACHGGQACKADGSGFEACDCGPAIPAPPSGTPPVAADQGP